MPEIDFGVIGTVASVIGFIFSLLSFLIQAVIYATTYTIFVLIVFVLLKAFQLFGGFSIIQWLAQELAGTSNCVPLQP